jgi:cobalt-precorrin-5B (C1)-methyltransferase
MTNKHSRISKRRASSGDLATGEPPHSGFTTGTCAAAAAKAATMLLCGQPAPSEVEVEIADGTRVRLPVTQVRKTAKACQAAVRKDAGSDPDVTHGSLIMTTVAWGTDKTIAFHAGEGVGIVTKPGLAVPPGEPAINPVPRRMIQTAIREITSRGVRVTISIPGGEAWAAKTFNPRLGVTGGLSILGTTGRVRPIRVSGGALKVV